MEERNYLIPQFGPFRGMRVIGAGSLIAMPFAASLLAEFGAEFIQIERPKVGDTYRKFLPVARGPLGEVSSAWVQEARNRLSMTLKMDMKNPDSREIFYGLIEKSDVLMKIFCGLSDTAWTTKSCWKSTQGSLSYTFPAMDTRNSAGSRRSAARHLMTWRASPSQAMPSITATPTGPRSLRRRR